jgi:hypothetical protein
MDKVWMVWMVKNPEIDRVLSKGGVKASKGFGLCIVTVIQSAI